MKELDGYFSVFAVKQVKYKYIFLLSVYICKRYYQTSFYL